MEPKNAPLGKGKSSSQTIVLRFYVNLPGCMGEKEEMQEFRNSDNMKKEAAHTLQGTNISHLGKMKIIFKSALGGNMLVPRRVYLFLPIHQ